MPQGKRKQPDLTIDATVHLEVIKGILERLNDYIFPEVAQEIEHNIRQRLESGEYDSITSAITIAETLTSQRHLI